MSAIVTPGLQQNKSKSLDQVCDVIRQAGKSDEADLCRASWSSAIRITPAGEN